MTEKPLVSLLCAAYNQKDYIAQTIEGFLMQKVNFPIEIIIHDDASTDGTADIIRKYETENPGKIRGVYQSENQYSKKIPVWNKFIFPLAQGKYFAECEGDDYWIDPNKIQRQVDFLENHSDYVLSTENANILYTKTNVIKLFSSDPERDITLEDLLIKRRFPTASVLYRSKFIREFIQKNKPSFDTAVWAYLATKGKIHFNPVISSIYRRGSGVTETDKIKWAYRSEVFNEIINSEYKPSARVRKARKRIQFFDYKSGWKAAKKQNRKKDARKLFARMLFKAPSFFIKDLIKSKGNYYKEKIITKFWNCFYKILPAPSLKQTNREIPVVVSLTSYPARFNTLHLVIKSILNQKKQPDKVVLYLDKTVELKDIPSKVTKLQKKGLIIRNICEDIKPHKKYFYAMQEYPDAAIITIDDDVIYPKDTISSLYNSFQNNPKAVSARRVHRIMRKLNGESASYNTWEQGVTDLKTGDKNAIATGIGGVLYPPRAFDFSKPYLQISTISEQCLYADDIWLAFIERLNNIPISIVSNKCPHPYEIEDSTLKETALRNQNVFENRNDFYIQKCRDYFGFDL